MPARWPARIGDDRHAIAARIVGEVDIVGRADAAHDVAFGMTERHRSGRRGRRRAGRAVGQRIGVGRTRRRHPGTAAVGADEISGVTGLSGVSGGVSIETFRMNTRPGRENQSASFDSRSDARRSSPHSAAAPSSNNASSGFRSIVPSSHAMNSSSQPLTVSDLSHHHFAARPWLPARPGAETADYH